MEAKLILEVVDISSLARILFRDYGSKLAHVFLYSKLLVE